MQSWSRVAEKALQLAYTLSENILVLHITSEYTLVQITDLRTNTKKLSL
jgi:hypothetical protein